MNTKILMMASAAAYGLIGLATLFIPQEILTALDLPLVEPLPVLIQLIGAGHFSLALTNWMAKNSAIGGIYSRPLAMGNLSHTFIGAVILGKYQLANEINGVVLIAFGVYAIFAALFWWLAFKHTGLTNS